MNARHHHFLHFALLQMAQFINLVIISSDDFSDGAENRCYGAS